MLWRGANVLSRARYELQKRLASRLCIFALAPHPQVLSPVNHCAQLREAAASVRTRDQLVGIKLMRGLQPAFAKFFQVLGLIGIELFLYRVQHPVQPIDRLGNHMEG
jgi:hypothetical protein